MTKTDAEYAKETAQYAQRKLASRIHLQKIEELETRYYGATGGHAPIEAPAIETWEEYKALLKAEEDRFAAECKRIWGE